MTPQLSRAEQVLYHQVHPLKLATDILTAVLSLFLLAQHRLGLALLIMWAPSVIVSALFVRFGDFTRIRDSSLGAYLRRHMTPAKQALRFAGLAIAAVGAWLQLWWLIPAGTAVIVYAWFGPTLLGRHP